MAIQISTGSLIALGIGAGDVAAIVGLSKRLGNWYSASSGDAEFLSMLDEDEFNILRRRGLIDLRSFNKRWSKEMRLFANGKPIVFKKKDADKVLEPLGRFTAIMCCIVAVLDAFVTSSTTYRIIRNVLKALLRTTERGEDLLATQYPDRLNSWRSLSCIRGFTPEVIQVREKLLKSGRIREGLMPAGESPNMEAFLFWLLADSTDSFITPSSDIAGVAVCLSQIGIDILAIEGLGFPPRETSCRLVYDNKTMVSGVPHWVAYSRIFDRQLLTTVSLLHPEECIVHFPTSINVHNYCRQAWLAGQRAAKHVALGVVVPKDHSSKSWPEIAVPCDIRYSFINRGTEAQRVSAEMQELAALHSFLVNQQLLAELQTCLGRCSAAVLAWLSLQTSGSTKLDVDVSNPGFQDEEKINFFCIFQSFFMGYYYDVCMRIIDTTSLKKQTVDGNWGFRSKKILSDMRHKFWKVRPQGATPTKPESVSRQTILELLSVLFLNYPVRLSTFDDREELDRNGDWCMGIIARKTILVNSFVNECNHPGDIGRFVLLDVDVGGIPRNSQGIIRSAIQGDIGDLEIDHYPDVVDCELAESSPSEKDASVHVEADWEGDPDKILLVARYDGRRLLTLSPALADLNFCKVYVDPVREPETLPPSVGVAYTISNLVEERRLFLASQTHPMLVQFQGKPVLRYIATSLFSNPPFNDTQTKLASNCIHAAKKELDKNNKLAVIIAGQGKGRPVTSSAEVLADGKVYDVERSIV